MLSRSSKNHLHVQFNFMPSKKMKISLYRRHSFIFGNRQFFRNIQNKIKSMEMVKFVFSAITGVNALWNTSLSIRNDHFIHPPLIYQFRIPFCLGFIHSYNGEKQHCCWYVCQRIYTAYMLHCILCSCYELAGRFVLIPRLNQGFIVSTCGPLKNAKRIFNIGRIAEPYCPSPSLSFVLFLIFSSSRFSRSTSS